MTLLLDTHVLLWWLADDERLAGPVRTAVEQDVRVLVSAASVWEIEVKRALGRLEAPEDLLEVLRDEGFEALAISAEHALQAGRLPRHHDDPFDRVLVAQARSQGCRLVTADRRLQQYDVDLLPAG